ncbi:MAG: helix-turn-helix domain-containing protein [Ruminococcus flavefaciens]|nr:helix-turn-helix domain-containing protein [Ruminococcus flavefaciens]MCM1360447.1 helix-turn-helix domain-containing protein [Clostridiales bacterium]MCM1434846.1 helix-turn-helix domain-containing protein [Ruminococcus flavefaciens]
MVDFGTTLKELRQSAGLTQKQLAEKLWLSKATVSYYEQSLRYPSPEILVKLSNVFHVSTDYLLGIEDKKQTLDVTGLPDEDIKFLEDAVSLLRKKNQDLDHS